MTDTFKDLLKSIESPITSAVPITSGEVLTEIPRAIIAAVNDGGATMTFQDDSVAVSINLVAGVVYPFRIKSITSAVDSQVIVGLY